MLDLVIVESKDLTPELLARAYLNGWTAEKDKELGFYMFIRVENIVRLRG